MRYPSLNIPGDFFDSIIEETFFNGLYSKKTIFFFLRWKSFRTGESISTNEINIGASVMTRREKKV